jgi:tRNA G26 N,N-dimethylase Trm1
MLKQADKTNLELVKLLNLIEKESKINKLGFIDLHKLAKIYKKPLKKHDLILKKIKKEKFKAAITHFKLTGIRTDISTKKLDSFL